MAIRLQVRAESLDLRTEVIVWAVGLVFQLGFFFFSLFLLEWTLVCCEC